MSDSSIILCVDGHVDNNEALAAIVIQALQRKKITQSDLTDCVLGGLGYGKGKKFSKAVQCPEEGQGLSLNGVKVLLDPAVYYSGEINPEFEIICPACNQDWFKNISVADFYMENLTREQLQTYDDFVIPLYEYKGMSYELKCPHCGEKSVMTSYDYRGMVTFANLAFEFFNWGDLKDGFISQIEKLLKQTVTHHSKLY